MKATVVNAVVERATEAVIPREGVESRLAYLNLYFYPKGLGRDPERGS